MGRPKGSTKKIPSLRLHKPSGNAVVTLNGEDRYLGKFGTPEAAAAYEREIGEWLSRGRQVAVTGVTVVELIAGYVAHLAKIDRGDRTNLNPCAQSPLISRVKTPLTVLRRLYGDTPAADFGTLALARVRDELKVTKINVRGREHLTLTRTVVNRGVDRIVRMFRWGASVEIVPASVWHNLKALEFTDPADDQIREGRKVHPADEDAVDAVVEAATPTIAAMITVQRLTAMRPTELCIMRACDIKAEGDVWFYTPQFHKTEHKGVDRVIPLGPKAQAALLPYMRNISGYLFQPATSLREWSDRRRAAATGRVRERSSRRKERVHHLRPRFDAASYRTAVLSILKRLNADRAKSGRPLLTLWRPNQLRHLAATKIASAHDLETARILLGHTHSHMTENYAKPDVKAAATVMMRIG